MEEKKQKPGANRSKPNKSANIGALIFLSVFAVLLAVATGLLLQQVFESRTLAETALYEKNQLAAEKQELTNKLDTLEEGYTELSERYEHLESQLYRERARIRNIRAQLQDADPAEAQKYMEQVKELEQKLAEYQQQVDQLEAEKQSLESEKSQMQASFSQTADNYEKVRKEKKELEDLVNKASYLTISDLTTEAIRERRRGDRPTDRARRTDRIDICFTINENIVAETGHREFYIRVIDPHNNVLTDMESGTFVFEGDEIKYSINKRVNFRNERKQVCFDWSQDERFESGYYNVVIFTEGREVGYKLFELN